MRHDQPVVLEYRAIGLTWGYGTDMIGTHVCRDGLPAAGDRAVLACVAGPVLISQRRGDTRASARGGRAALANRVQHPVNVYLREDQLTGEVDAWLAREFAPHRLYKTIADLADAQLAELLPRLDHDDDETALKIAECDRKLAGTAPRSTQAQAPPRSPRGSPRRKQRSRPSSTGLRTSHASCPTRTRTTSQRSSVS
jgi:hypothetical protein